MAMFISRSTIDKYQQTSIENPYNVSKVRWPPGDPWVTPCRLSQRRAQGPTWLGTRPLGYLAGRLVHEPPSSALPGLDRLERLERVVRAPLPFLGVGFGPGSFR